MAEAELVDVARHSRRILDEVERAVVGKRPALELLLIGLLADGHVLIEDYPGLAKTLIARSFAQVASVDFARIQFTPDLMPADVTGSSIFDQAGGRFEFRPGPIFTNLLLADEINRAPPKTQSALLEAMEERQVTVDGETRVLPEPFFVIATQNPVEQIGAYPLPESQLDRFLLAIELGYPDAASERELLAGGDRRAKLADLVPLADAATLVAWQREATAIHVAPALLDYVQALLAASRGHLPGRAQSPEREARRGLSPRAGLMLIAASRALALVEGRSMVVPEHVQKVFPAVAGHRLAGSARAGALQAQALLRAVPLP